MKRFAVKMLAAALLMAVSAVGLAQDNQNEKSLRRFRHCAAKNVQVLSSSACGHQGRGCCACEADGCSLYVLSEENGQWKNRIPQSPCGEGEQQRLFDTDELLILSWQEGACLSNTISGGRRRGRSVL